MLLRLLIVAIAVIPSVTRAEWLWNAESLGGTWVLSHTGPYTVKSECLEGYDLVREGTLDYLYLDYVATSAPNTQNLVVNRYAGAGCVGALVDYWDSDYRDWTWAGGLRAIAATGSVLYLDSNDSYQIEIDFGGGGAAIKTDNGVYPDEAPWLYGFWSGSTTVDSLSSASRIISHVPENNAVLSGANATFTIEYYSQGDVDKVIVEWRPMSTTSAGEMVSFNGVASTAGDAYVADSIAIDPVCYAVYAVLLNDNNDILDMHVFSTSYYGVECKSVIGAEVQAPDYDNDVDWDVCKVKMLGLFGTSTFNLAACMQLMFVPGAADLAYVGEKAVNVILSAGPMRYSVDLVKTVIGTYGTNTLPSLEMSFPTTTVVAGHTLDLSPWGNLMGPGSLIASAQSRYGGNWLDRMLEWWDLCWYLLFGFMLIKLIIKFGDSSFSTTAVTFAGQTRSQRVNNRLVTKTLVSQGGRSTTHMISTKRI